MLRAMDDDRSRGWLAARVELAIAVIVVVAIPILYLGRPPMDGDPWPDRRLVDGLLVAAEVMAIVGLAWMVRIWRGPLRDRVPAWRYRDRNVRSGR